MTHHPRSADYDKRVRQSFAYQAFMRLLSGELVRDGRSLKICRTEIYAVRDGGEKHCATALATIVALKGLVSPAGGLQPLPGLP